MTFRPTCPHCDEINPPEAEGCVYCGAALTMDEYERRQGASMFAARQHRRVTPQPVDNSVEGSLLDRARRSDVESSSDADRP